MKRAIIGQRSSSWTASLGNLLRPAVLAAVLTASLIGARGVGAVPCDFEGCSFWSPGSEGLAYRDAQKWVHSASGVRFDASCLHSGTTRYGCLKPHDAGREGYVFEAANGKLFYLSYWAAARGWTFMPYGNLYDMPNDALFVLIEFAQSGNADSSASTYLGQLALQPGYGDFLYDALSNIYAPQVLY